MKKFYLDREKDIKVEYEVMYNHTTQKYKLSYKIVALNNSNFLKMNLINDHGYIESFTDNDKYSENGLSIEIAGESVADIKIFKVNADGNCDIELTQNKYLSAESKVLLSQEESKNIHFVDVNPPDPEYALKTDLHSHYAAILPPTYLIALGIKHNIEYDRALVKKYKLDAAGLNQNNEKYNFIELLRRPGNFEKIEKSLRLPSNGQVTFTQLERVYDARDPFIKGTGRFNANMFNQNKELFSGNGDIYKLLNEMSANLKNVQFRDFNLQKDYLLLAARYTKSTGVDYLEASQAALAKPNKAYDFLKMLHETMPAIEKDPNCAKIRFLAAARRNAESDIDFAINAGTIKLVSQSPYVVGCDFMGEELNETDYFKDVVKQIAENAIDANKDFTIRIHAGENQLNIHNVKQVLEIIQEVKQNDINNKIHLRIGHGLYGIENDAEAMAMMKTVGAVNEFNLTSNIRLNNLSDISKCPMKKYLENGIQCVQGTDGGGIYGTTVADEQGLSQLVLQNIDEEQLTSMKEAEEQFLQYSNAIQAANTNFNPDNIRGNLNRLATAKENIAATDAAAIAAAERYTKYRIENIEIINKIPPHRIPLIIVGNRVEGYNSLDLSNYNVIVQDDLIGGKLRDWINRKEREANIYHVVSGLITDRQFENLQRKQVIIAPPKEYGGVYKVFESIFEKCKQARVLISNYESDDTNKSNANNTIINNIIKAATANRIENFKNMNMMRILNRNEIYGCEKIDLRDLPTDVHKIKEYLPERFANAHDRVL